MRSVRESTIVPGRGRNLPRCGENTEFLNGICRPRSRSALSNREFEALLSDLNDLVNN